MCQLALEGKEFPELGAQGGREEREQVVGKLGRSCHKEPCSRASSTGMRDVDKRSNMTSFALGEIKTQKPKTNKPLGICEG